MSESTEMRAPASRVLPHELPASLRDAGLTNWIREPLDDAVNRRRRIIMPPAAAVMGTPASAYQGALLAESRHPDTVFMMGDNPALPTMPPRPTLKDFFDLRFSKIARTHLLQSARMARENGPDEKVVMACLLHDIANGGLLRADHGYWGAQMIAPVCGRGSGLGRSKTTRRCAISPDEAAGYKYPDAYDKYFGPDYQPAGVHPPGCRGAATSLVHDVAADHHLRHLQLPKGGTSTRRSSPTSSAAISGSRPKAWDSTTRRWRTCGAP